VTLFTAVPVPVATSWIFRGLAWLHVAAAASILAAGGTTPLARSALLFVGVSAAINRWPRYRRSPFALIASVGGFMAFVFPLTFLLLLGDTYEFGVGLRVPGSQSQYFDSAPSGIAFLSLCYLLAIAGLTWTAPSSPPDEVALSRAVRPEWPIGLLGIVVLVFAQQAMEGFLAVRVTRESGAAESLWQFLFFDQAYLIVLSIVIFTRLAHRERFGTTRIEWVFGLLLGAFFLQATLGSTSKGFLMTLAIVAFVIPLSYLQNSPAVSCLVPSRKVLLALVPLSIGIFFVVQGLRIAVFSGDASTLSDILSVVWSEAGKLDLTSAMMDVSYRLGAALDRYILIHDHLLFRGHQAVYAAEYQTYLLMNLANLLLLGTPYPEAYVPSSNLLPAVLMQAPLLGDATKGELIQSLNTQPHTLFGVAIILVGKYAPMVGFVLSGMVGLAYRLLRGLPARLALICLFNLLLQCYGLEVSLATALHFGVSFLTFVWLMRAGTSVLRTVHTPGPQPSS